MNNLTQLHNFKPQLHKWNTHGINQQQQHLNSTTTSFKYEFHQQSTTITTPI